MDILKQLIVGSQDRKNAKAAEAPQYDPSTDPQVLRGLLQTQNEDATSAQMQQDSYQLLILKSMLQQQEQAAALEKILGTSLTTPKGSGLK